MEKKLLVLFVVSLLVLSSLVLAEEISVADDINVQSDVEIQKYLNDYRGEGNHENENEHDFSRWCYDKGKTLVSGRIFMADTNVSVPNANITVECDHNGKIITKTTTSDSKGKYKVIFNQKGKSACNDGDIVTVTAEKDGNTGSETGEVVDGKWKFKHYDVAFINVPLVPEFGITLAIITVMGALGAFFVIRRQ